MVKFVIGSHPCFVFYSNLRKGLSTIEWIRYLVFKIRRG